MILNLEGRLKRKIIQKNIGRRYLSIEKCKGMNFEKDNNENSFIKKRWMAIKPEKSYHT